MRLYDRAYGSSRRRPSEGSSAVPSLAMCKWPPARRARYRADATSAVLRLWATERCPWQRRVWVLPSLRRRERAPKTRTALGLRSASRFSTPLTACACTAVLTWSSTSKPRNAAAASTPRIAKAHTTVRVRSAVSTTAPCLPRSSALAAIAPRASESVSGTSAATGDVAGRNPGEKIHTVMGKIYALTQLGMPDVALKL